MIRLPESAVIAVNQVRGIVKEKNDYRDALEKCLKAFNEIPLKNIHTLDMNTYEIASEIHRLLRNYNTLTKGGE